MKLEQYILNPSDSIPTTLELPTSVVHAMRELYERSTREQIEYGANLIYEEDAGDSFENSRFKFSKPYSGIATGVTIRSVIHNENFADVHCHPSASIGHAGGYSAHSMEDFLVFKHHQEKPIYIRFVVAGKYIYAAVFRRDYTRFSQSIILEIRDEIKNMNEQYFYKHIPYTRANFNARRAEMKSNEDAEFLLFTKKSIPDLGKKMQETSLLGCQAVAKHCGFHFYQGTDARLIRIDRSPSWWD